MASSSFRVAIYLFFLLFGSVLLAQDYSLYQEETLVVGQDSLPFRILPPKDLEPGKTYPLILFLHGSGERGSDKKLQLTHGADLFLRDDIFKLFGFCCPIALSFKNIDLNLFYKIRSS